MVTTPPEIVAPPVTVGEIDHVTEQLSALVKVTD
jgi:hypothetical protein